MPFVTEELWQALPANFKNVPTIMYAPWPESDQNFINLKIEESFSLMEEYVREIRRMKHDFDIPLKTLVPLYIEAEKDKELFELCKNELIKMAYIDKEKFKIESKITPPPQAARIVLRGIPGFIPLKGMIDFDKQRVRVTTSLEKTTKKMKSIEKKLQSQFVERAPKELVEKEKQNLSDLKIKIEQLIDQLKILE